MMTVRNEIKAQIVRAGYTMQEVVDRLHEEYDWSDSVSNLSAKLQRESIRYKEVVELADVLDQARDRVKERKARTRRLIQEGAVLEKVLPEVQAVGLDNLEEYLRRKLAAHD